jgi:hypothetical protein
MPPELAAHRVRAALGREPQDRLEAAVVLETWGVSTEHALAVAGPGVAVDAGSPPPVRPDRFVDDEGPSRRWQALWLCLAVLAAVAWTEPVIERLSPTGAGISWRAALPAAFFLQWFIRRRYLAGPGLGRLRGDVTVRRWLVPLTPALVAVMLVSPVSAAVVGFVVVWSASTPLVHRRWGPAYVVVVSTGTVFTDLFARLPLAAVVGAELAAVTVLLAVATWTDRTGATDPLPPGHAAASGVVGAMFGGVIALAPVPVDGRIAAIFAALVPQMLGSAAWYAVLDLLWPLLRNRSHGIIVTGTPRLGLAGAARLLLARAVGAYVVATVAASVALVAVAHTTHGGWGAPRPTLLEFAVIGLAGVTVGSLDAFGRTRQAFALTTAAIVVAAAAALVGGHHLDLVIQMSSVTAVAVAGYLLLHLLLAEPERTYAQNF